MKLACYILAIQGSHGAELTAPDCAYASYQEAEAARNKLLEKNPSMTYMKVFVIYFAKKDE